MYWDVLDLITAVGPPLIQALLTRIFRYTNTKKGWAWPSQQLLAHEMKVSRSTVERAVKDAKAMGVIDVLTKRTGMGQKDQHNEYRLNLPKLKSLYAELPALVREAQNSSSPQTEDELPSNGVRAPRTSDGGSKDLKHIERNAHQPPLTPPQAWGNIQVGRDLIRVNFHSKQDESKLRNFWTKGRANSYVGAHSYEVVSRLRGIGLDAALEDSK